MEHTILIYVQQDAKLHSLFYLETALHVSGGTITHHQERKQLYLQHLVFVRPLLLPDAILSKILLWRVLSITTPTVHPTVYSLPASYYALRRNEVSFATTSN